MGDFMMEVIIAVMLGIFIVILCICTGFLIVDKVLTYEAKKREIKDVDAEFKRSKEKLEYSKEVLEYIRHFAAQIISLRFQEFLDSYHLDKITKEKFKNIVETIITEIHESINMGNFDFSRLMYNKKFIEIYLIQTCLTMCKKMLEKALIEFEE